MTRFAVPFLLASLLFLGYSQENIKLFPEIRKQLEIANKLFRQAETLSEKAEKNQQFNQQADTKYREALITYDNILKDSRNQLTDSLELIIRLRKGYIEYYFDSLNASKNDYLTCLRLKEKVPAIPDSLLFSPLLFTGGIYYTQNQYDSALHYYKAAEAINEKNGNSLASSQRLYNRLGVMHYETGNYKQAKNYFEKAITELSKHPGTEKSLLDNYKMNIAALTVKLEEYTKAKEIYESLLPSVDYSNEIHHNLGIISLKMGDYQAGLEYLRKVNYGQSKKTTDLYYNFYWAWAALGNTDSAEVYLHEALAANLKWNGHRKNTTYGLILKLQGDEELKKNKYNEALLHYQQAIIQFCIDFNEADINKNPAQFSSSFSYINLFNTLTAKADALYRQSRIEKNIQLANAALHAYETAFSLADYVNRVYTSDESRLFLGSIKHSVHSKPIDICLSLYEQNNKKEYLEKAWLFDQQNKAAILSLNIQETEWRNNNEQGELLNKESSLKIRITRLSIKAAGTTDTTITASLAAEIRDLEIELENVNDELNNDPRWLQRKSADIIPAINQLQKKLDNTTALISYHLSEEGLLSFLITGTKFNYFRTSLNNVFYNDIKSFQNSLHNVDQERNYDGTIYAMNLYQVLIRPLKHGLNNIKRLIIIPDDELNYLPFEALQNEEKRYLTEQFSVTYQYSATLFDQRKNSSYARGTLGFA
ncbi:MAG TPA: CHAT domain-containing protein, partial [Chitinophagaceae bacterium]|nr:CHAT domain-containing protein [Chitinophagaceae bacterium]